MNVNEAGSGLRHKSIFAFNHCFHYRLKINKRLESFKYNESNHCIVYQGVNKRVGIYRAFLYISYLSS